MDKITVCMGSSCFSKGNKEIAQRIINYINQNGLDNEIQVQGCLCRGFCKEGPVVEIKGKTYTNITESSIESILRDALGVK